MKLNCATFEKCFDKECNLAVYTAGARKEKLFLPRQEVMIKSQNAAIPGNHSTSSLVVLFVTIQLILTQMIR